jgi:hypothetical protein
MRLSFSAYPFNHTVLVRTCDATLVHWRPIGRAGFEFAVCIGVRRCITATEPHEDSTSPG